MGNDRTGGSLQPADRRVGVDRDDETISQRPGRGEIPDVADMEKIKTAVGEDDLLPLPLERSDPLLKR